MGDRNNKDSISKRKIGLSNREMEVLYLIAYEYTNQEIADKLFLSKGTIATYRNNLLTKLESKNTAGLVRIAFEKHVLSLGNNGNVVIGDSLRQNWNNVAHYDNNVVHIF